MSPPSNIRVSVRFREPAVFAGEDVECIITLTNRANDSRYSRRQQRPPASARRVPEAAHARRTKQESARNNRQSDGLLPAQTDATQRSPLSPVEGSTSFKNAKVSHERSISIISIKSEDGAVNGHDDAAYDRESSQGRRSHARGLSVQTDRPSFANSRRQSRNKSANDQLFAKFGPGDREKQRLSLAARADLPSIVLSNGNESESMRKQDAGDLKRTKSAKDAVRRPISSPRQAKSDFKFPNAIPPMSPIGISQLIDASNDSQSADEISDRLPSPEITSSGESPMNPIARLLAASSINGTPRSSIDLQSEGGRSDETSASEYPLQQFSRLLSKGLSYRQSNKLEDVLESAEPEHLMMGYAQVTGNFILDGSLVNQNPFEEVKRKCVVGGQGAGGVVGVERKKRDSGLFGNLGWSSIGDSFGNLLNSGEMSSIKEMRDTASSRAIPILSTPQSILFVDLKLAPGESKQYSFAMTLPRGLPPSHKGRAIKITYILQLGLQQAGAKAGIRMVEIPFRVFSTVNARGEVLFHDLLSPHVSLKDNARTSLFSTPIPVAPSESSVQSDLPSFLAYAETLLDTDVSTFGLLSPTLPTTPHMRRNSSITQITTSKEAIDLAIMKSHQPTQSNLSTRYSIARSRRPVATLMLHRSAYRLGETIHLIIDFAKLSANEGMKFADDLATDASSAPLIADPVPVYAVLVTLETHETVEQTIAMRSPQSIYRYTRKIHAQAGEKSLFSRRLCFALAIPPGATAEFGTTGVGLEWRIRVEFMTPILKAQPSTEETGAEAAGSDAEDELQETSLVPQQWTEQEWPDLLEEMYSDDRGQVFQGIEQLYVDTFEVAVPVRVYSAIVGANNDYDVSDVPI